MVSETVPGSAGFWFDVSFASGVDVLNALRRFRTAEAAAVRRTRDALGLGGNDLTALRTLLAASSEGRETKSKDLSEALGITAASTTALVDRLVRSGFVERRRDPVDRRGVILSPTGPAIADALVLLRTLDQVTTEHAERLPTGSIDVVVAFLDEMTEALLDQPGGPVHRSESYSG